MINILDSGTTPVTFQVIDASTNFVIPNVRVMVYRDIAGVSTLVDDGYTDTAGTISYYLNPITPYTIITSGGGCNSLTSTITPSNSQYNLLLDCQSIQNETFSSQLDGVIYQRTPADGITAPGEILFSYYIESITYEMKRVKFEIIDAKTGSIYVTNDSLTDTTYCSTSSCLLTLTYPFYIGDNVKGRYYVGINGTSDDDLILIEGDAYWRFIIINQTNSVNAIGRFMLNLQDLFATWGVNGINCYGYNETSSPACENITGCKFVNWTTWAPKESEDYQKIAPMCIPADNINKIEFNRIVVIFFVIVIVLFILGRTTGYELNHPGSFVVGMSIAIWALSLYGLFTFSGLTQFDFFNQYIFALSTSCIGLGYAISIIRRYSQ